MMDVKNRYEIDAFYEDIKSIKFANGFSLKGKTDMIKYKNGNIAYIRNDKNTGECEYILCDKNDQILKENIFIFKKKEKEGEIYFEFNFFNESKHKISNSVIIGLEKNNNPSKRFRTASFSNNTYRSVDFGYKSPRKEGESFGECFIREWNNFCEDFVSCLTQITNPGLVAVATAIACNL